MKIFFTGAQGSGKTTLVNELKKYLPDYEIIDSLAKDVSKKGETWTKNNLMKFQISVLGIYLSKWFSTDNFISSRSISDTYAYLNEDIRITDDENIKSFYNKIIGWTEDLKDVFNLNECIHIYVPPVIELKEKEGRSVDKEFQKRVDQDILNYLDTYKIRYIKVEKISIEDRVNEIITKLKEFDVNLQG